jgi:hypothetical protein
MGLQAVEATSKEKLTLEDVKDAIENVLKVPTFNSVIKYFHGRGADLTIRNRINELIKNGTVKEGKKLDIKGKGNKKLLEIVSKV